MLFGVNLVELLGHVSATNFERLLHIASSCSTCARLTVDLGDSLDVAISWLVLCDVATHGALLMLALAGGANLDIVSVSGLSKHRALIEHK